MRKYSILFVAGVVLLFFSAMLSSCKKNHEDPVKPKLSFSEVTRTVKESDGDIEITMTLDQPAPEAIDITYELSGTAFDKVSHPNDYDYEITSSYLDTKIKKGETSGKILISLFSDFDIDNGEVIEISIKSTDSDNIEITRDDEIKITVEQEDGLGISLAWSVGAGENYTDVDMDLLLWVEDDNSTLVLTSVGSAASGTSPKNEFLFLPTAPIPDGNYGLSCIYYAGTPDPMNFAVFYEKLTNGVVGTAVQRLASYHPVNINNTWDQTGGADPLLVATFTKSGSDFTNFSEITVPPAGSRIKHSLKLDMKAAAKGNVVLPTLHRK
jgi:hypothetical protein